MITKHELIEALKKEMYGEILSTNVRHINMRYDHHFAKMFDIDLDKYPTIDSFNNNISNDEIKAMFNSIGFDLLCTQIDLSRVIHFVKNEQKDKSINQAFLDNERNVFVFSLHTLHKDIYFVLEYAVNSDPLADHTVDREAVA